MSRVNDVDQGYQKVDLIEMKFKSSICHFGNEKCPRVVVLQPFLIQASSLPLSCTLIRRVSRNNTPEYSLYSQNRQGRTVGLVTGCIQSKKFLVFQETLIPAKLPAFGKRSS